MSYNPKLPDNYISLLGNIIPSDTEFTAISKLDGNIKQIYIDGIFTDTTSILKSDLLTLVSTSQLKPKQSYSIIDSYHGGTIIVTALKNDIINPNGIWIKNTNLCAFGIIGIISGTTGSVNTLTINGVNIMTSVVNYTTSLSNTSTLVANNINENVSSSYIAIAINEYIVIQSKFASTLYNGQLIVMTTTTIVTSTSLPLKNGFNPVSYNLSVSYDITKDRFNLCVDTILNNTLNVNLDPIVNTVDVYNDFRWGDNTCFGNVITSPYHYYNFVYNNSTDLRRGYYSNCVFRSLNGYMQRNFIAGSPTQTSTQSYGYSGFYFIDGSNGFIQQNVLISNNNQAVITKVILMNNSGMYLNTIHCTQVFTNGYVFFQNLTFNNGGRVYLNKSLGQGAFNFQSCYIDGVVTISCIALSLITMYQCSIGVSSIVSGVVNITASFRIYRINIIGRTDNIFGITAGITNFSVNNSSIACGFYDIQIIGGASVIPNITLNSNGATIRRIALIGSNLSWGNFTTTDDFNIISDYTWTNDQYSFVFTSPTLDGTTNKGLVDSVIKIGIVPDKWYGSQFEIEGSGLISSGGTIKVGIDVDNDSCLFPVTTTTALNSVITSGSIVKTKATAIKYLIATPQTFGITTGIFKINVCGKIGL